MTLTDSSIRALKTDGSLYRKRDGGGLYIEVAANGAKVFRLAYRFAGKQRTLIIGPYPEVKLAEARGHREEAKTKLRAGVDPGAERDARRPKTAGQVPEVGEADPATRWDTIARSYLEKRAREKAAPATLSKLALHAEATFPAMGEKQIQDITAQDVIAACRPYERQGKLNSAHSVRTLASQIFRYAIAHGLAAQDPASPVRDAIARPSSGGYAGITEPARVGELMRAIRGYQGEPAVRAGMLLSAYLFPRNGEIRRMRWTQIDFETAIWTVPGAQMKKGREHLVPLPRQALDVLAWIRPMTVRKEYILHSPTSDSGLLSENTFNMALRRLGFAPAEHVHHGFRTTASTNLNELGWNVDWIERQLAHVEENKIRGAYNRAQYLPRRVEMMQAYADWLDGLEASDTSEERGTARNRTGRSITVPAPRKG